MVDFVNFMLNDEAILGEYAKIDSVNPYPSNHGMKHIYGVLNLVDKISPLFNLTEREIVILKTCVILHDIGQTSGRQDHGKRGAEFAKNYLPQKNIFNDNELLQIYSAIEYHDEYKDYSKLANKFSWFVNLVDKLDFSRTRLEDNYRERFDYSVYEDVEKLEFFMQNNTFKIVIKTVSKPQIISEDMLFSRNLFSKAMYTLIKFCEHFNLKAEVYLDEQKLDLNKINTNIMMG